MAVYSTRRSVADLADDHQAGVDADAHVKALDARSRSSRAAYSCAPATISSAARMARSASSSWAGARRKGQDGVAHQPRQRPFVAVDGRDEHLEGTVS